MTTTAFPPPEENPEKRTGDAKHEDFDGYAAIEGYDENNREAFEQELLSEHLETADPHSFATDSVVEEEGAAEDLEGLKQQIAERNAEGQAEDRSWIANPSFGVSSVETPAQATSSEEGSTSEASPPRSPFGDESPRSSPEVSYAAVGFGGAEGANWDNSSNGTPGTSDPNVLNKPFYGASMGVAFKRFFTRYARFRGYSSLSEFWWATLALVLLGIAVQLLIIVGAVGAGVAAEQSGGAAAGPFVGLNLLVSLLLLAAMLALVIPSFSVTWRRLHDAGFSGLWALLSFIPFVSIAPLVMCALPTNLSARRPEWDDNN